MSIEHFSMSLSKEIQELDTSKGSLKKHPNAKPKNLGIERTIVLSFK